MARSQSSEWIQWFGGECPVLFGQVAETKLRDGRIMDPQPAFVWDAGRGGCNPGNPWSHSLHRNDPEDITAYRLVQA